MRLVKGYMNDDGLRHELNKLTQATFWFDFESWVTNGYFEGDYIPYSFEEDGKILSNVSVNLMHFIQNGQKRNYIQIGTVMTDTDHRNKGLAGALMNQILDEYKGKCDGIYLFGNLSALGFYRKMGFQEKMQYQYTLKDDVREDIYGRMHGKSGHEGFVKVDSSDAKMKAKYCDAVRNSVVNCAFEQENKYGLQMFYTAGLENVYYSEKTDCFVVLEQDGDTLELNSIISPKYVSLEQILCEINSEYKVLKLGVTPRKEEQNLFDVSVFDGGEDYRLFCLGECLDSIESEKLYFPALSHA